MSGPTERTTRLLLAVWFILGVPIMLLALFVHPAFLLLLLGLMVVVGTWSLLLPCDFCGHRIVQHQPSYGLQTFAGLRMPRRCRVCHCPSK